SVMAAGSIQMLPSVQAGPGAHSPFSISHPLFAEDGLHTNRSPAFTSPDSPMFSSTFQQPQGTVHPVGDAHAKRNVALLAALAGPLSGPSQNVASSTSGSLPGATLSNLDQGGYQSSAGFSTNSGFGRSGSGSSGAGAGDNGGIGPNGLGRDTRDDDSGAAGGGNGDEGGDGDGDGDGEGDGSRGASDKDKSKKTNPLVDLLETEAAYVSELSKVIKKVAAAWSRSNFPPPELDTMFRNIEAIYRANRSFLKALKEIGPNPSSPKALGDLLMKWIEDLEAPYARFCDTYLADFDAWGVVQSNPRLSSLLAEVSNATDADGKPVVLSDKKRDPSEPWTLDALFALPHIRLKYYKKLYSRLLKSTQPGRSDHRLLVGANHKLDDLLERSKRRLAVSVLDEVAGRESRDSSFAESNVTAETSPGGRVSSATSASDGGNSQSPNERPVLHPGNSKTSPSATAVLPAPPSPLSPATTASTSQTSAERAPTPGGMPLLSSVTPPAALLGDMSLQPASISQGRPNLMRGNSEVASIHDSGSIITNGEDGTSSSKTDSMSQPLEALESRLDTSRTLDIFTMKPKKCQLQIHPPNLPFTRALRKSQDVMIHFTPSSGGEEISIRRAHMFLLTDLFLVCERMTPSEQAERSRNGVGPDMWLLYPPLAGKHLRVADLGGQGNVLSITILKKEKLIVQTESRQAKEEWLQRFDDCQKFAATMGLKLKTGNSLVAPPGPGGSAIGSGASLGASSASASASSVSANANSTTPGLSPAISVTPSSNQDHTAGPPPPKIMSPDMNEVADTSSALARSPSDLSRQASFNSVASFPKVPATDSPDLASVPFPSSTTSPRSPSPSQFGGPPPHSGMPGFGNGGGRPPQGGARAPGMMSPTNGMLSPDTSPAFGPSRMGPGGLMSPGMGRPPLMRDPNMPPGSPGGGPPNGAPRGPFGPGGAPNGFPQHRGPSPVPGQMPPGMGPGGPGGPPGMGPGMGPGMSPGMGPGGGGPGPFMQNGGPRPPMPRPPPPPSQKVQQAGGRNGAWNPSMGPRDPTRRPSAPNLRQASHGSSGGARTSDEGEGRPRDMTRTRSVSSTGSIAPKLPSAMMKAGRDKGERGTDVSPPTSPVQKKSEPMRSTVSAQMRCKLFLKQSHAQWKSLGNARLKLYHILPDDVKQLVVENDRKTLISTIILTDGVERVGKVGVAVELSDRGNRTGIVYMLQMRSEESAGGLFGQLLEGSDR
ncbi:hypothetical protein BCV70DRAFT_145112, partial [Testicularia cyperi]